MLQVSQNLQENTCAEVSFLIMLQTPQNSLENTFVGVTGP